MSQIISRAHIEMESAIRVQISDKAAGLDIGMILFVLLQQWVNITAYWVL